jgi:hypothetical protein
VPTLFVGLARDHNSPLLIGLFARWASDSCSHSRNSSSVSSVSLKFENSFMDFSFASSCVGVAVRTSIASSNVQVRPFLTSNSHSA